MKKEKALQKGNGSWVAAYLISLVSAVVLTALFVILEALVIKASCPGDRTIRLLNYAVRVLSLAGACFIFARSGALKAWQRGTLLGVGYWGITYLLHVLSTQTPCAVSAALLDGGICILICILCSALFAKRQ